MTNSPQVLQESGTGVTVGSALDAASGRLNVMFILDRSGSMADAVSDVIGGFNSLVDGIRQHPRQEDVRIGLVRFDTEVETLYPALTPRDVPVLTPAEYWPRGSTALLDAVGQTVAGIADTQDERFLVIVHTDGHENASREWTSEGVRKLIADRTALGNWTFVFFGADIDAWAEAGQHGWARGNAASYMKADTPRMYNATRRSVEAMMHAKKRATGRFADAVQRVMDDADASDAELQKVLEDDEEQHPS